MSERHTLPRIVPAEDGYYEGGDFVSFRTACCVKCGKTLAVPPGYSCSGHVKTCDGKHILAGWCSDEDADRFCDLPSENYSQVRKSEDEELAELDAKEKRKEEAEKLTTFVIVASLIALYWVGCR
jgi:hypothetical protein